MLIVYLNLHVNSLIRSLHLHLLRYKFLDHHVVRDLLYFLKIIIKGQAYYKGQYVSCRHDEVKVFGILRIEGYNLREPFLTRPKGSTLSGLLVLRERVLHLRYHIIKNLLKFKSSLVHTFLIALLLEQIINELNRIESAFYFSCFTLELLVSSFNEFLGVTYELIAGDGSIYKDPFKVVSSPLNGVFNHIREILKSA